jgi:transposase
MDQLCGSLIDENDYSKNEKSILYLLIQAFVFSDFGVSIVDINKITDISERTIRRVISQFKQNSMLVEEKYGKTIYYNLAKEHIEQYIEQFEK